MPPVPAPDSLPRVIVYHQTHHDRSGQLISALPLIGTGVTHVYIAAIHLNNDPANITLNDHSPYHERNAELWEEVKVLQEHGIKVLGMLGGAAKGSYGKLEQDFEAYYASLHALIKSKSLDGLDLDIEEPVPLGLVSKLLHRLRADFGTTFLLTLAPVLPAMIPAKPYLASFTYRLLHPEIPPHNDALIRRFVNADLLPSHQHLSGFSHFALESSEAGRLVDWYNVQFYCGWGDAGEPGMYSAMVRAGFNPKKLILGVVTNPAHGSGHVDLQRLERCISTIKQEVGEKEFGGVMGWEYHNAGEQKGQPHEWVRSIGKILGRKVDDGDTFSSSLSALGSSTPTESEEVGSEAAGSSTYDATQAIPTPEDTSDIQAAMQDASILGGQANTPPVATSSSSSTSATLGESVSTTTATAATTSGSASASASARDNEAQSQAQSQSHQPSGVDRLVEMGFERAEAIAALEAMGGNADAAAGLLFGN